MVDELPALSRRIVDLLALDPTAPLIEFQQTWLSWGDLAASAAAVAKHVEPGERVGVMLRNRPQHVGLLVGLLSAGACVVTVNPSRGADRVRADLAGLGVGTVAGDPADLAEFAAGMEGVRRLT